MSDVEAGSEAKLFDHPEGSQAPLRAVENEVVAASFPASLAAWRAKRKLAELRTGGTVTLRLRGRIVAIEGQSGDATRLLWSFPRDLLAKLQRETSSERLYAYLSLALVLLTIGTWFVPCTATSVALSGVVAVAVLVIGAASVRGVAAGPPFLRSLGILALSAASFFILFSFAYAIEWLYDPDTLTWDGTTEQRPRLGEMFLVSLGFLSSGGTIVAEVHHAARITAYVQLLLGLAAIAGVAGVLIDSVRRRLASSPRREPEGSGTSGSQASNSFLTSGSRRSSELLYASLSLLLVVLTVGAWFVPCTVASVTVGVALALALLAGGAALVRSVAAGPPFLRSLGILALSAASFFILFSFAYAIEWLYDPDTLTWDGTTEQRPRLGEMFLVSLGFLRAGGTIVAEVHHAARITAYVQLLVGLAAIAGVAGLLIDSVRTRLASSPGT